MNATNSKRISDTIKRAAKHYSAETFTPSKSDNLGEGWTEVAKGLGPLRSVSYISYGFADAMLAILEGTNGFEVGTGEALRPYLQYYRGQNENQAVTIFLKHAHTDFPEPKEP